MRSSSGPSHASAPRPSSRVTSGPSPSSAGSALDQLRQPEDRRHQDHRRPGADAHRRLRVTQEPPPLRVPLLPGPQAQREGARRDPGGLCPSQFPGPRPGRARRPEDAIDPQMANFRSTPCSTGRILPENESPNRKLAIWGEWHEEFPYAPASKSLRASRRGFIRNRWGFGRRLLARGSTRPNRSPTSWMEIALSIASTRGTR